MSKRIGVVTHFFTRISVAVVKLETEIKQGEWVQFLGYSTDFIQRVDSMQIDHHAIQTAGPGEEIAIEVIDRVRRGDELLRESPEN